jgi:hypothetical protein
MVDSCIPASRTPQLFEISQPNLAFLLGMECSRTAISASCQGVSINYGKIKKLSYQLKIIIEKLFDGIYGHFLVGSKCGSPSIPLEQRRPTQMRPRAAFSKNRLMKGQIFRKFQ